VFRFNFFCIFHGAVCGAQNKLLSQENSFMRITKALKRRTGD
jgi:hypothetical protein